MSRFNNTLRYLILPVIMMCAVFNSQGGSALTVDDSCKKVETIFARGSGATLEGGEATRFWQELNRRLTSSLTPHHYELGMEKYGGYQYPAVDVGNFWNGNALGAITSAGQNYDYGNSVRAGVLELQSYISQRYEKCKSFGTFYILGGHSQGAQVIGQALQGIMPDVTKRIIFAAFFGDPKLYLPEGEGGDRSPACRGIYTSPYRKGVIDCKLHSGRLQARKPYLSEDMKYKSGLWCHTNDFVCGTSSNPWAPGMAPTRILVLLLTKQPRNQPKDYARHSWRHLRTIHH